jgi:hypothetical protein
MTWAVTPDLPLEASAEAGVCNGAGVISRVEAQLGPHVTEARLNADLRAAPECLAARYPAVVISDDGHASVQLDVTAIDIWLALLEAMVSVRGVFHEPLSVQVVRSAGSESTEHSGTSDA